MSRTKKLGVLFIILLCAIALYFGARILNQKTENADLTSVMNIKAEDITGLKWTYNDETVELAKSDDVWKYTGDDEFDVDESKITEITNSIADLKATAVITKEEQTEDFGFMDPKNEIVVSTAAADTTYTFGNINDVTNEYYLKISGSENIFMVSQDFMNNFEKNKDDIQAPTPTPAPTETPAPEDSSEPQESAEPTAAVS